MKVTLNIQNDDELRAYIRDMIRGQVLSIVRDEYMELVKAEIERKIKSNGNSFSRIIFESAAKQAISSILYKEHSVSEWNKSFINPIIEEVVKKSIAHVDWDSIVNDVAKEKIKSLIR